MAKPPATNDAFFREVDDELRRDQLVDAWRRWGRVGVVAIVAALALFAGWLFWQNHRHAQAGIEGEQLRDAYDQIAGGQAAKGQAELATLTASSRPGYRAMALMTQGDQLLARKDLKGAAAKYAAVAGDGALGQPFRDLALIRQTTVEFDTLPPATVVARLRALAVPGNPWFGSAGELIGIAYARQGRRDLAGRLFSQIARGDDVPSSIRQRAVQMAGQMGGDAAPTIGASPKP